MLPQYHGSYRFELPPKSFKTVKFVQLSFLTTFHNAANNVNDVCTYGWMDGWMDGCILVSLLGS